MKTTSLAVLAALALAGPSLAHAVEELRVALPERHELVELQPGLQVIPDFDLEVFFTGNAYWLRSDGHWYQARRPAASCTFTLVDPRSVPAALARLPAGSHLHFKAGPGLRRSTKVLALVEAPEREPEPEVATPKVDPQARPAPSPQAEPAPAKAPPAKAPTPKPAPAKAPPAKKAPAKPAPLPRK
jgi:hypothetical protein